MQNSEMSAGTNAGQSTNVDGNSVSQTIAKPLVIRSLLQEVDIAYKYAKEYLDIANGNKIGKPERYEDAVQMLNKVKEKRKQLVEEWVALNCG